MSESARHEPESGETVIARVTIAARPETVWTFLSDSDRFAAWIGSFGGGPALPGTRIEPRAGGQVRVAYPHQSAAAVGKIVEMTPLRRLVMTWGYEDGQQDMPAGSTRIEINLTPVAAGTLVELRHSGIPTEQSRRGHFGGWTHYLSMLARSGADAQHANKVAACMEAYYHAWAESDAARRGTLLGQSCEPDLQVRTSWACTNSIDELSQHIAGALMHMPGMKLAAASPPRQLHGYAVSEWVVNDPSGNTVMRGTNFIQLSPSSRLATLVSFSAPQP